ncbi:MAG: hypothetical protein JW833_04910 [Prolixibacteraceae bacterium]|nr:hypothetical protein [Prolixibacteraceae bacterium]
MVNLKETNNSVFIENIPCLEWGKGTDNSFVRSTQLALNALGENYSYNFLMGISGAAFRLHFNSVWCPSSADSTTGYDVSGDLFRAVGHQAELFKINDGSFKDIKMLFGRIKEFIDRGIPLVAINLKGCTEWGIVTGYLKNKPGILCRTYFDESEEYSLAERAPWLTFFITEKKALMNDNHTFRKSLEIAVKHATTEKFEEYYSGFKAFGFWIDQLKKAIAANEKFKESFINRIIFNCLYDSRRAAAGYLESLNNYLKSPVELISNYKNEVELMDSVIKEINNESVNHQPDILNKQTIILEKILGLEKRSIELIEEELM